MKQNESRKRKKKSDPESRIMEITQSEQQTEIQMKSESTITDLWDNIMYANLQRIPEGE